MQSIAQDIENRTVTDELIESFKENGLTALEVLLVILMIMKGILQGMVQKERYMGSENVRELLGAFNEDLNVRNGSILFNRLPMNSELVRNERKMRKAGLSGCCGFVNVVTVKTNVISKVYHGGSVTMKAQYVSDIDGY